MTIRIFSESQPTLAAAESNNAVHILKFENGQLCEDAVLKEHKELIVGIKFSTDNQQTVFTASNDGVIKLWDLRTPKKAVLNFIGTTINSPPYYWFLKVCYYRYDKGGRKEGETIYKF